MKKNDIALIILIVSVTMVIAFFLAKAIIGEPERKATKVEVVEPISATLERPQPTIFHKDAINPTVVIQIGNPANKQPFNGN